MAFHPSKLRELRGSAKKTTHLACYDRAANTPGVKAVLEVGCPDCGAQKGKDCHDLRS